MSAWHISQDGYDRYRGRADYATASNISFQNTQGFAARPHLPTPTIDDTRARTSSPFPPAANDPRQMNYRLPQPFPMADDLRRSSMGGMAYDYQSPATHVPGTGGLSQVDMLRRASADQQQQLVMVPTYLPMYHDQIPGFEPWQQGSHQQAMPMQLPYGSQYGVPSGYGYVQRPLPPAPMGPVEKPKRRRAPPAPQYLHMTVQEMIEELAYRKIDTSQMQARKAKKAEYIDQLQTADRENNLGRGAWKSCHGDVPPISSRKDSHV